VVLEPYLVLKSGDSDMDTIVPIPQLHKPIAFTTSPFSKYTHWKQTVLYFRDTLTVSAGEHITGTISSHPNAKNPRDLDIALTIDFEGAHSQVHLVQDFRLR